MRKLSIVLILLVALLRMANTSLAQTKIECPAFSFYVDSASWKPLDGPNTLALPESYQYNFIRNEKDFILSVTSYFDNGMKPLSQIVHEIIMDDPSCTTYIYNTNDSLYLFKHNLINVYFSKCFLDDGSCLEYISYFFFEQHRIFGLSLICNPSVQASREVYNGIGMTLNTMLVNEIPALRWDEEALVDYFTRYANECKSDNGFFRGNRMDTYVALNQSDKTIIINVKCLTIDHDEIDALTQGFKDPEKRLTFSPEQPEVVRALQLGYKVTYRFYVPLQTLPIGAVSFTKADLLR